MDRQALVGILRRLERASSVLCLLACLVLAACDNGKQSPPPSGAISQAGSPAAGKTAKPAKGEKQILPISRLYRDYQKVHPSVDQAWFLIESAYFVVGEKLKSADKLMASSDPAEKQKGSAMKAEVSQEIQHNLFGVNPKLEALFDEAIKAEPDNPLNLVAYAVYLKPRKDFSKPKQDETLGRALELMDQASAIWPDESSFYMIKAQMLVTAQMAYEFSRSTAHEEDAIVRQWPEIEKALIQAEKYDPENSAINYYRAQLMARFAAPDETPRAVKDMLREIKAGNSKPLGHFVFPPPLEPYTDGARTPQLDAAATSAVYYDQWMDYGWSDIFGINKMLDMVISELNWPQDKAAIGDVMYMYYNMGRIRPYERSYFSWQQKLLQGVRDKAGVSQQDKTLLSSVLFKLGDYYAQLCGNINGAGVYVDAKEFNAAGLNKLELAQARNPRIKLLIQPVHASYLQLASEKLGLDLPLSKDPKTWGE